MFNQNFIKMKSLRLLFATLIASLVLFACSPNHGEEIEPDNQEIKLEKFEVKSSGNGEKGNKPKPGSI